MTARASGVHHVDLLMSFHRTDRQIATFQQSARETFQTAHLLFRGLLLVEVSNQANAQGNFVLSDAVQMTPVQLLSPTIADSNAAIAQAITVADEKMVGEAVFHMAFFPMITVKRFQGAGVNAGMVNDDIAPTAGFHGRARDAFLYCLS